MGRIVQGLGLVPDWTATRSLPWKQSADQTRKAEDVRPIFWANRPGSYVAVQQHGMTIQTVALVTELLQHTENSILCRLPWGLMPRHLKSFDRCGENAQRKQRMLRKCSRASSRT